MHHGHDEDQAKLEHLIDHWVEHNRSHEESYSQWAERAKHMGQERTAELIEEAVACMKEADVLLLEALRALKG